LPRVPAANKKNENRFCETPIPAEKFLECCRCKFRSRGLAQEHLNMYMNIPVQNPGSNPTTSIYNASVVNFYNATGGLARFENKNILFYFENALAYILQRWRCSCKFKNCRIGL
jgi:hypothetical protein